MYKRLIKEVQDFVFVENDPERADIIFIPGNGYPQMAERAAELYREGYAPLLLPSGKYSVTAGKFSGVLSGKERYPQDYETEWEFLRDVLVKNGVPESAVLCENRASYTYENAIFSRQEADRAGLTIKRALLCCKTYHARRALMYYQRTFPEAEILVIPVEADGINKNNWTETAAGIDGVMGEAARIVKQFSLMM